MQINVLREGRHCTEATAHPLLWPKLIALNSGPYLVQYPLWTADDSSSPFCSAAVLSQVLKLPFALCNVNILPFSLSRLKTKYCTITTLPIRVN